MTIHSVVQHFLEINQTKSSDGDQAARNRRISERLLALRVEDFLKKAQGIGRLEIHYKLDPELSRIYTKPTSNQNSNFITRVQIAVDNTITVQNIIPEEKTSKPIESKMADNNVTADINYPELVKLGIRILNTKQLGQNKGKWDQIFAIALKVDIKKFQQTSIKEFEPIANKLSLPQGKSLEDLDPQELKQLAGEITAAYTKTSGFVEDRQVLVRITLDPLHTIGRTFVEDAGIDCSTDEWANFLRPCMSDRSGRSGKRLPKSDICFIFYSYVPVTNREKAFADNAKRNHV